MGNLLGFCREKVNMDAAVSCFLSQVKSSVWRLAMGFLRLDALSDPTFATIMKQHTRKAAQPSPPKNEKQPGYVFDLGIDTKKHKNNLLLGNKLRQPNTMK